MSRIAPGYGNLEPRKGGPVPELPEVSVYLEAGISPVQRTVNLSTRLLARMGRGAWRSAKR